MTDDIVARLRGNCSCNFPDTPCGAEEQCRNAFDAADEIERLLEEIQQLKHDSTIFINERSDAICENFDLREENAELRGEIGRLRAVLEEVSEAVGDPSAYMIARAELGKKETKQSTPGYEHMTPETVQAIRDTCSTPASRVGKTQSEVFKEEDTP